GNPFDRQLVHAIDDVMDLVVRAERHGQSSPKLNHALRDLVEVLTDLGRHHHRHHHHHGLGFGMGGLFDRGEPVHTFNGNGRNNQGGGLAGGRAGGRGQDVGARGGKGQHAAGTTGDKGCNGKAAGSVGGKAGKQGARGKAGGNKGGGQ